MSAAEIDAATLRVEAAQVHLAKARDELERACRDLSSVIGATAVFRAISKLCDGAKEAAYDLEAQSDPMHAKPQWKLDHEPSKKEMKSGHHACGSLK